VAATFEGEFDAPMGEPLAVETLGQPELAEERHAGRLQDPGAHTVLDVLAVARLENDGLDAERGEQVGEDEASRSRADDRHVDVLDRRGHGVLGGRSAIGGNGAPHAGLVPSHPRTSPVPSAAVPAVELTGVSRRFGRTEALAAIDLRVETGEIVTVLGPSGSGKTTLLRIVGGLVAPTTGSVVVDGLHPTQARAAKRIGFVPQRPALLPWRTVEANARLLLEVNRRRAPVAAGATATELLGQVGLADFLDAYPHELSGGMQQRVSLARALALGAPLLLMDEPFAALDEITRTDMRHLLTKVCEPLGTTVLFVTHSIAEAVFLSDRVVVLSSRPGRVVATEPVELVRPRHAELENDPAFFALERRLRILLHEGMAP
jgi:NitT/TauT family transport system ATP-binding protein